jgi:hypothetical protein
MDVFFYIHDNVLFNVAIHLNFRAIFFVTHIILEQSCIFHIIFSFLFHLYLQLRYHILCSQGFSNIQNITFQIFPAKCVNQQNHLYFSYNFVICTSVFWKLIYQIYLGMRNTNMKVSKSITFWLSNVKWLVSSSDGHDKILPIRYPILYRNFGILIVSDTHFIISIGIVI